MNSATQETAVSERCRRTYDNVVRLSEQLLQLARQPEERLHFRAEHTSSWSVADHLNHLARANQAMAAAIRKVLESETSPTKDGLSLVGRAVLLTGWIPRGVGKAPEYAKPQPDSRTDLTSDLEAARQTVAGLAARLPQIDRSPGRSRHFAFGGLRPSQWLRIMEIHTRHHLKIIDDIQSAAGSPWKAPTKSESTDSAR
ncbi:MAG: DinB family protein [Gemmatimonadota bacterium]|nr:MAG: DinB family protein [Gemmatimonadota bacterium]